MADKKEKQKESFVMYDSFINAASYLDGDDFKECILKIRDYALYGSDEPSDKQIINAILAMAKPNLDAAEKRRQRQIENGMKGKEYGILGGRPKSKQSPNNPSKPLKEDNEKPLNDDVNENENENEYVDGNVDGKENEVNNHRGNKPSSIPSSSISNKTIDNKRNSEQQTSIIPSVINKEEINNKTESSGAAAAAAAAADKGISISEYLIGIVADSLKQMHEYDESHRDYDEKYKNLHVEAVKALMAWRNLTYEKADEQIRIMKKEVFNKDIY